MTTELPRTPGAEPTRPVPVVPRRLGGYELGERLGEGGMGVVWRATDRRGREVAVKVLREHIAHDEQARERLRREVHTLARVHHPRVAAVVDADVDGPAPFIVTEYVPGPPLDEVVAQRGPLTGEALLRLGRGLGEALHAIHGAGIVHRDLKPGNVLMVGDDPVVIDFGIAQVADDVRLTMTGMVMGTPGYLSPEVVDGGAVSQATDWWGWAATIAYAASGQPPFGRGPLTVVLDRVLRGRLALEGVDPQLAPLLRAALDPDPLRRPTEAQVLDGLERYARREDVTGALPVWMAEAVGGPDRTATHKNLDPVRANPAADGTLAHVAPDRTRVSPRRRPDRTRLAPASPRPAPASPPPVPASAPPAPSPAPVPPGGAATAYPWPQGADVPQPGERGGPDPRLGRSARTGTLLAMLVGFTGLAATAPLLAWGIFAVWGIVARTVDRSLTSLVLRRHEAGRRRSDVPMLVLASPWHLVWAVLATALSLVLAVGLAAIIAVVGSGLLNATYLLPGLAADDPLVVGVGSTVGAWIAWWGLASTSLRRGSRTVLRSIVPRGAPTLILVTLCLVGGAVLLGWSVLDGGPVSWWPLGPEFDPRDLVPSLY